MSRTRTSAFKAEPAVLENVPLLIGLAGPPGGGKTLSALLIAQGIQQFRPGPIRVIDTEAGRSRKYAPQIPFEIVELDPPHRSDRFKNAIIDLTADNPAALIIDTFSDEHEGSGGMLEWHEEEIDAQLLREDNGESKLDNQRDRDRVSAGAWRRPKAARRELINTMGHSRVPLILTFRAREKTKPIEQTDDRGRKRAVPTNVGFQPIAPVEVIHLMDLFALLPLRAEGRPLWKTGNDYADFALKCPEPFKPLFQTDAGDGVLISPAQGTAMALWARGEQWGPEQEALLQEGREVTADGYEAFKTWWRHLAREKRVWLARHRDQLADAAKQVDELAEATRRQTEEHARHA